MGAEERLSQLVVCVVDLERIVSSLEARGFGAIALQQQLGATLAPDREDRGFTFGPDNEDSTCTKYLHIKLYVYQTLQPKLL